MLKRAAKSEECNEEEDNNNYFECHFIYNLTLNPTKSNRKKYDDELMNYTHLVKAFISFAAISCRAYNIRNSNTGVFKFLLKFRLFSQFAFNDDEDFRNTWSTWDYTNNMEMSETSIRRHSISKIDQFWQSSLDDNEVTVAIKALVPYCTPDRLQRVMNIVNQRTDNVRFIFENPVNVNNVWAALRTLDSFGVQFVDIILPQIDESTIIRINERKNTSTLLKNKRIRRGNMNAALGSQQWITLQEYSNSTECLIKLRNNGFKLFATDLTDKSVFLKRFTDDRRIEFASNNQNSKIAIIMGNEDSGISQQTRELVDGTFYIPMYGFAESLNLSIATAVICSALDSSVANDPSGRGLLAPHFDENTKNRTILTWLSRSIRGSLPILRRAGLPVNGNSRFNTIGRISTRP